VTAGAADEALAGPAPSAMAEVGVAKPKYKARPTRRDAGSAMVSDSVSPKGTGAEIAEEPDSPLREIELQVSLQVSLLDEIMCTQTRRRHHTPATTVL
jgi:hypothetical protein